MKLDIVGNAKRNVVAGLLNRILTLILPFVNRTLFIWWMGAEYLGLNGLFTSLLGVLSLAELGFGQAVVCAMYKPVADDDRDLVSAYYAFYRTVFRLVGCFILVAGLSLLPFLPKLVHGSAPPGISLTVVYLIHLANAVLSYFLFAYKGVLLTVHQRVDVKTHIRTGATLAQYVVSLAVLCLTRNYYWYVLSTVVFTVLTNVLIARATARLFPDIVCAGRLSRERRRKVLSDVGSLFLHRIGSVISYSADNLVISACLGLVSVAAYGNYYTVYKTVSGFVNTIYESLTAGFGNAVHTQPKRAVWEKFRTLNVLSLVVVSWCAALMLALYQPFMALWTGKRPELLQPFSFAALMVVFFYVNYSRQVLQMFKSALGLWREDRLKPVVSGVANLAMNLALIRVLGLKGAILSTILAFLVIEIPWEGAVVFRRYLRGSDGAGRSFLGRYVRLQLVFAAFAAGLCAVTWGAAACVPGAGFGGLVLRGAVAALVATAGVLAFFRRDLAAILAKVRGGRRCASYAIIHRFKRDRNNREIR